MSLELLKSCPVCGSSSFKPFLICKDYTTSEKLFHVEQCSSCEMVLTNPRPEEKDAQSYYQSKSYISHTSAAAGIMDYIYLIVRRFTLGWKYRIITKNRSTRKLLDIGAGTGHFVMYCQSKGITVEGVEPSTDARANKGNNNIVSDLNHVTGQDFDVITMWHVLEHVYKLDQTLEQLKKLLAKNGTIFIAVPNWKSPDAKHYKETWAAYDVPRHIWHFSKETMTRICQSKGLKVTRIVPMKLDAYYVSLLSEKYRNNGIMTPATMMKGFLSGIRSNWQARKTQNNSSLIYVIQNEN